LPPARGQSLRHLDQGRVVVPDMRPRRFAMIAIGILNLDDGFTLSQQIMRPA
jgi:hypothetical protein